jgi:hypothetical protein
VDAFAADFSTEFSLIFGSQLILGLRLDFQGGVSSVGAWDCRLVHPGDGPYPLGGVIPALIARSRLDLCSIYDAFSVDDIV